MSYVASTPKTHAVKHTQSQQAKATQASERSQGAFESMLDDNAAATAAAAKDQATTDRTQTREPAKTQDTKSSKSTKSTDTKSTTDAQAPAKPDKPDKPEAAEGPETAEKPVVVDAAAVAAATNAGDVVAPETADEQPKTDETTTDEIPVVVDAAPVMPTPVVPEAVPVQTLTPADAQPQMPTPEKAAEITETPPVQTAAAVVAGATIKPLETEKTAGEAGKTAEAQPAKPEQTTEGDAQTAKTLEHAQKDGDTKPAHAAPNEADKEHIARARGTASDTPRETTGEAQATQTDTSTLATKSTADVPVTPQAQTTAPTSQAANTAAPTAAGTAQTAQQTVPLAGVGVEIASKAIEGKKSIEIRLDPPELGRIEVKMNVDRNGHISSHVIADRQDTLDLLKRDSSGLERALQDAGLKTSDSGMQFSLRDQSANQQQDDSGRGNTTRMVAEDDTLPTIDLPAQSYGRMIGRSGGLDIRV